MKRWRPVDLVPGDLVPPGVYVGLVFVADDSVVDLVEYAAARQGVRLERLPPVDERSSSSSSTTERGATHGT